MNNVVWFHLAELFDVLDALIGSAEVSFSVEAPCFCYGVCGCDVSIVLFNSQELGTSGICLSSQFSK